MKIKTKENGQQNQSETLKFHFKTTLPETHLAQKNRVSQKEGSFHAPFSESMIVLGKVSALEKKTKNKNERPTFAHCGTHACALIT